MKAQDDLLEHLRGKLRDAMNTISDHMIEGGCEDFAGYREMVGKINGLALAERELLDLDEMIHRSDKETL